jgi:hypothetical protein
MSENYKEQALDHLKEMEDETDFIEGLFSSEEEPEIPEHQPKLDADYAGYMELEGAVKDGDCTIVYVEDGISKKKGCCNLYHPVPSADRFNCGHCKYLGSE